MQNISHQIVQYLLKHPPQSEADILAAKRDFCKKLSIISIPTNAELLSALKHTEKQNYRPSLDVKYKQLKKLLRKRQVRTLSGVAPIAVLTKPYKCSGTCAYCPDEKSMPKSYLSNEPAVMRAILCKFNPYQQVTMRLRALTNNGHPTDKLELIVMGGTWHHLPEKYRLWYITQCFKACNDFGHKNITQYKQSKTQTLTNIKDLINQQKRNEKALCRIIGLTLETRPDCINQPELLKMRQLGCTRIEIGVQHTDDHILKLNHRGHGIKETIQATRLMRDFGFKITYHLMLNLPGSTPAKDLQMCRQIFSQPQFQPDQIKLYPCVVTKQSLLYKWWRKGKYKPYSTQTLIKLLVHIKSIVPEWVRIIRVIRDIPEESIIAGNKITNLRQNIKKVMENSKTKCRCIRCREVGHQQKYSITNTQSPKNSQSPILKTRKYTTNNSEEYFLSFESKNKKVLYAFCRLKIPNKSKIKNQKTEIINSPIIRELHTYGQMVPINNTGETQHKGLGKKLMLEAEKIAKQQNFNKLYVISGIGVRPYYRKLGYRLASTYMLKYL